MKIVIGADHGGQNVKLAISSLLIERALDFEDIGSHGFDSVDYPDFAIAVAERVMEGRAQFGILVCTTGIGMSIAANRYSGVRAALCATPELATTARSHNDANVLVLPGDSLDSAAAQAVAAAWLDAPFSESERHQRRIAKIETHSQAADAGAVARTDPAVYAAIKDQVRQEQHTINLIASENSVSRAVRQAQGCVMTNKYAEGYPEKRWYNGCRNVDRVETLAMERAKALFGAEHANVQPHCGSAANMAVYMTALEPGETILAMRLDHGGHLTHGSPVNFSGRLYRFASYGVTRETETIDYDALEAQARECRPKLIVAGASAYPRILDFKRFREIADAVDALLMVDMAHIAGLVAGGVHPSPVPLADFVTTTTHKTLRGPRSGMILCKARHAATLDKTVFPGLQGGPQMHSTAAKAVCLHEAMQPEFADYAARIVSNARALAERLLSHGFRLVADGTDTHLMLVDLTKQNITGREAANALDAAGLICNKNAIPFDERSPFVTSGIRLGTPAVTTRGMNAEQMCLIADWIAEILGHINDETTIARVRESVDMLCRDFPVP